METQLTYADPDLKIADHIQASLNCHPVLAKLLVDREICDPEDAKFFLNPDFSLLRNPFDLKGIDRAVERIYTAVINKEKIFIFGDFDADGVTATSVVYEFLSMVNADLTWYIPHRVKEGYSLHPPHIDRAVEMDVDLIITVDCGISSHEAVDAASKEDIDVIITDHHEPGKDIPNALAVINPKQKDCGSDLNYLAGVGVAFYLIMALRKYFRDKGLWEKYTEPSLAMFLDLFTIGTIGDMVPLINDNRSLCVAGMRQIKLGARPGIKSMAHASRIDLSQLDSDDISFKIVPRINAAGRVSHARICVSHLTAPTLSQAKTTAQLLDELNLKRQQIEREIVQDIENRIAREPSLLDERMIVLWSDDWEASVLGIAASRLSRKYVCPVVLLSVSEGMATGSCRSVNQINIHEILNENNHLFEKFGGHAMAAGLTVQTDCLELLKPALVKSLFEKYSDQDFIKTFKVDAELNLDDITIELAREIDQLRPFGTANPEPVFLIRNLWVTSSQIIGSCHRKMILKAESSTHQVEALHFNLSDTADLPNFYSKVLFKLKINKFKPDAVQIIIQDL